jgi:chorismate dehydratase
MSRTVLASVRYTNAVPLTAELDPLKYEVRTDHPAGIAEALKSGEVAAALVPVAAVLGDPDLRIVPGQAIGSDGAVASVLLVAETPPSEWTDVVLDGESRTSALLVKVLLDGPLRAKLPNFREIRSVLPGEGVPSARGTTAALVIGDTARNLPDRLTHRVDLGAEWKAFTGLPFVFAVWAGRPDLPAQVREDLRTAAVTGLFRRRQLVAPEDYAYVTGNIRYELDDYALMGLRRFAALAKRGGHLPDADVRLYGPLRTSRPRVRDTDHLLGRLLDGEDLDEAALIGLLTEASPTELGLAADLARRERHPDDIATWRPLEAGDPGEPVATPASRWIADPAHRESFVRASREGHAPCLFLAFDGDLGPKERVRALLLAKEVLDQCPDTVAFAPVVLPGRRRVDVTAADNIALVALARLVLDVPHLVAPPDHFHSDVAQARLMAGCDDLGARPAADADEIERAIREAGLTPAVRDARFDRAGTARTDGQSVARRQPWTPLTAV